MSSANRLAESVKPVVEQLEGRRLMTITANTLITDSDGHVGLFIRGDSKNDTVHIIDDPVAQTVTVTANGVETIFEYPGADIGNAVPIEIFDVDTGGGTDRITFEAYGDAISANYVGVHRSLHLDGDSGNDTILLTIPGGIVGGSEFAVDIDGDSGNDNITMNFNYLRDSKLDLDIKDGEGNDISLVNLPNLLSTEGLATPNYNSTVFFDHNAGNGKNTTTINANTGVYFDGLMDIHYVGGNSTGSSYDTLNLDLTNTVVEGKMFVDVNALNGDDRINVLTDGLYVESFNYDPTYTAPFPGKPTLAINVNGNDGKDQITANATTTGFYIDETAFLSFAARGGNGDDKINVNFTGPINIESGGQFVFNLDGQNNNDTINTQLFFGDLGVAGTGGGQAIIQVMGGQNSDKVTALITDLSTNGAVFGPGGFGPVFDGQSGTDNIKIQAVNLLVNPLIRNFETQTVILLP